MRLSAFAGGYTRPFCEAVIEGMEADLPATLRRRPCRAGEAATYPADMKRKEPEMNDEERAVLTQWQRSTMQKVEAEAPTRKIRLIIKSAPHCIYVLEQQQQQDPLKIRKRLRTKTKPEEALPSIPEAPEEEAHPVPPPAPLQEGPVRPVIQRKWKKDKRMQSGGYWYVPKNRQNSRNGIRKERASSIDAGNMATPSGQPIARGPLLASDFLPQVSEVPLPEAAGPGDPRRRSGTRRTGTNHISPSTRRSGT